MPKIKRIGVLTSGGDGSGSNAAIRSVVRYGINKGCEVYGIFEGYRGLLQNKLRSMNHRSVSNIINLGGTILKSSRCLEFKSMKGMKKAYENMRRNRLDGLIVIGGNGSLTGAHLFCKAFSVPVIGIPATIDNDVNANDWDLGVDTALGVALDAIDKIRDTATSMERIFVVEVMGRNCGFIALQVALSGGAEDVMIPERKFSLPKMCRDIKQGRGKGKISWIIVVAEGAARASDVAKRITKTTGFETRVTVLGHIQRGGRPTVQDRNLGTRLGAAAVEALLSGQKDKMAAIQNKAVKLVGLSTAIKRKKLKHAELYNLIKVLAK